MKNLRILLILPFVILSYIQASFAQGVAVKEIIDADGHPMALWCYSVIV